MAEDIDKQLANQAIAGVKWLADRCDYAIKADGMGFSGSDAPLGHALAAKAGGVPLTTRETRAALQLVIKYQKQLKAWNCSIDIEQIKQTIMKLNRKVGSDHQETRRLRRRDIVKGTISVEKQKDVIILKTDYNDDLLEIVRTMIGRRWNSDRKIWTVKLCSENAMAAEELAERFGLTIKKHRGWNKLVPARSVVMKGEKLVISGVNPWAVVDEMRDVCGDPAEDEKIFRSVEIYGETSVFISMRSWIIKEATAWFMGIGDSHPLSWAREQAIQLMGNQYGAADQHERDRYSAANGIVLNEADAKAIRETVSDEVADRIMPHQWSAIAGMLDKDQIILADEQGLGKTIEVLAALESRQAWPAIVICPATAMLNWRDETHDWLPHRKVRVLGGKVGKKDRGCEIGEADLIVINYESFAKHAEAMADLNPVAVIADEAQYLKGYNSARTKAVKEFCKEVDSVTIRIAATGTPVLNRPAEMLTLLTILPDALADLGGFRFFAARYCRATLHTTSWTEWWDYNGSGNMEELAKRIRETGRFIRREKREVLANLPEKDRQYLPVEISNRQEYAQARDDFQEWLKTKNKPAKREAKNTKRSRATEIMNALCANGQCDWYTDDGWDLDTGEQGEVLKQIGALRQLTGKGKIIAAVDWIKEFVKDEKLVVFAYHIEVQHAIVDALTVSGENPLTITGSQSAGARRAAIQKFQGEDDARIIVCSLKAAQTAITLTAARRALMVELDWTPAGLQQAEDRIHRIGQNAQVVITYLVGKDTFDVRMQEILQAKNEIITKLTVNSKYGYRLDGTPRKQKPGPGRPRLDSGERVRRRKISQSIWQGKNSDYMRDYMRERRRKARE